MSKYLGGRKNGGVDWELYNQPEIKAIEEKYLPDRGEGETKATQAVTAITKLVYKWYNDGDVFDNTHSTLGGWCNDLSSYANWLDKYIGEKRKEVSDNLHRIERIHTQAEYEQLLWYVHEQFDEDFLEELNKESKEGSIYECEGYFVYEQEVKSDDN